jgi:hypothetical protein
MDMEDRIRRIFLGLITAEDIGAKQAIQADPPEEPKPGVNCHTVKIKYIKHDARETSEEDEEEVVVEESIQAPTMYEANFRINALTDVDFLKMIA